MLSVKQGGIKSHFLSLWYDSIWDWIQVSQAIGELDNRLANGPFLYNLIVFTYLLSRKTLVGVLIWNVRIAYGAELYFLVRKGWI